MEKPVAPDSGETRGPMTTAIVIAFTVFSFIFVVLRSVTRFYIMRRPGIEDYFLIIAMAASIVTGVCQVFQVQYGTGRHFAEVSLADWSTSLKYLFASIIAYNFSLTLTKTAILLQYLAIFKTKGFRYAAYFMIFFVFGYATEAILTAIFNCVPVEAFWTGDPTAKCIPREALWFANAGLNIFCDFAIALLPLPVIVKLNMPRRQKIPLMMIFALGFFICVVSILRLNYLIILSKSQDPTWDQPATAYWSAIEMNISIVCACLPALKPLVGVIAPSIFGTTPTPTANYNYKSGSNKIRSGGRGTYERRRNGHSDSELGLNSHDLGEIEISGGKNYQTTITEESKGGYYNSYDYPSRPGAAQMNRNKLGGIKQTTIIEQNVEVASDSSGKRDSGSESVRKLVHISGRN